VKKVFLFDGEIMNISPKIEPGMLPCCPLCDNEILEWEEAIIVTAHGGKALAHSLCAKEMNSEN
jgi:hypothetical protein